MSNKDNQIKIAVSVTDFPIFRTLDYSFSQIKKTGADGIELVHGLKSRKPFKNVIKLSKKHNLPILSIHQPLWTGLGIPDYSFINLAIKLNIKNIVIHPLPIINFEHKRMKKYFIKLASIQKRHSLKMLLENLPVNKQAPLIDKFFPGGKDSQNPLNLLETAKRYNFGVCLDTTHLEDINLGERYWLKKILPFTKNIHLSNFTKDKAHLPLHLGDMNYLTFLNALKKNNYNGLITLEMYYPKMVALRNYNYEEIKKSIEIIRKELKH